MDKTKTKVIRIDTRSHEIIRLEAIRQTWKSGNPVSMGQLIDQLANRINKKQKHVKGKYNETYKLERLRRRISNRELGTGK